MRHYPEWVHQELMNWSRWCWMGAYPHPLPDQRCGSVEREYTKYRTENTTDEAQQIRPNESRALIVQKAWLSMHDTAKKVIVAEYPQRAKHQGKAPWRSIGISRTEYDKALMSAAGKIIDAFERRN